MKLCMVRYGQTDWNVERRRQGWTDVELNENGTSQAESLHTRLSGKDFTSCYSSPLLRAVTTAQIITDGQLPIIEDERLRGRGYGEFEGQLSQDIHPSEDIYDLQLNAQVSGIEPIGDIVARTQDFLNMLTEKYSPSDQILIITHGIIMRIVQHLLTGDLNTADLGSSHLDNASILELDYIPSRQ